VYYALKDHLGSVLALTDTNGVIVESYRYDAWGRPTVFDASGSSLSASAVGNRFLWQGREYSWKTGLYYFRARWYDPITGRWLSNDPIGISGGLNQYVFCANNPVNFRDPFGLCEDGQGFWGLWGNAINNRVTAINQAFGANLANAYNWGASGVGLEPRLDFNQQYSDIVDLSRSTSTPANPGATPYIATALGISAAAATTAAIAGTYEAVTGFRIELHGTHGWTTPHLQGIQGEPGIGPPAWGDTVWRWPPH
jgi:RHS repeat-associated protein